RVEYLQSNPFKTPHSANTGPVRLGRHALEVPNHDPPIPAARSPAPLSSPIRAIAPGDGDPVRPMPNAERRTPSAERRTPTANRRLFSPHPRVHHIPAVSHRTGRSSAIVH